MHFSSPTSGPRLSISRLILLQASSISWKWKYYSWTTSRFLHKWNMNDSKWMQILATQGFTLIPWRALTSYLQPWQKLLHLPSELCGQFLWLSPPLLFTYVVFYFFPAVFCVHSVFPIFYTCSNFQDWNPCIWQEASVWIVTKWPWT